MKKEEKITFIRKLGWTDMDFSEWFSEVYPHCDIVQPFEFGKSPFNIEYTGTEVWAEILEDQTNILIVQKKDRVRKLDYRLYNVSTQYEENEDTASEHITINTGKWQSPRKD